MSNTRRRGIGTLIVGAIASASTLAALGAGTLGAFSATITNNANTAGSGTLTMQETNAAGNVVCNSTDGANNAATCATINKYGGNLQMSPSGAASTTTITIKNTGSAAAGTFTLTPGACTQSANGTPAGTATDFCSKLNVTIAQDGKQIYSGTAAGLTSAINLTTLAAGASSSFTFTVALDPNADNTYQGLQASQPLTWSFAA